MMRNMFNVYTQKEKERIANEKLMEKQAIAEAKEIKHQANMERIAKKMARIESGLPVEEAIEKPKKKTAPKKAVAKKTTAKKAPTKKRGRPKKK